MCNSSFFFFFIFYFIFQRLSDSAGTENLPESSSVIKKYKVSQACLIHSRIKLTAFRKEADVGYHSVGVWTESTAGFVASRLWETDCLEEPEESDCLAVFYGQ